MRFVGSSWFNLEVISLDEGCQVAVDCRGDNRYTFKTAQAVDPLMCYVYKLDKVIREEKVYFTYDEDE